MRSSIELVLSFLLRRRGRKERHKEYKNIIDKEESTGNKRMYEAMKFTTSSACDLNWHSSRYCCSALTSQTLNR